MMRQMKLIYALMLAMALPLMTACSSDDAANGGETPIDNDGKVQVHLRVSAAGSNTMRDITDGNASAVELMNLWTVVIVNSSDEVVEIQSCRPSSDYAEIDDVTNLTPGIYRFYSFANIGASALEGLLELPSGSVPVVATGTTDVISSKTLGDGTGGTVTDLGHVYPTGSNNVPSTGGTIVDNITSTITGNNFDPAASDNGFGEAGIPMSNVQTYTIASSGSYDLVVVRMMAKILLQIKNSTGASVTVKSATLSNVTKNSTGNLKLLPTLTQHDTMEPTHGDITPNLGTAVQEDLTIAINKAIANDATENVTFYVNECGAPDNPEGLFYLTLEMDNSGTSEYRYALIDQTGATTADDNKWAYIARNDYRIVPIELDDLKFEIIPYDFPAIGVYPVSVKEVDATNHVYDFEFHDYGHFHLLPSVTKSGTAVEFSATTPTGTGYKWTLVGDDFANSWFTASTKGGAWLTTNAAIEALGFYRTGYSVTPPVDGDEVGGIPVWYVNDGIDGPQWDPAASGTYRPFIFGYIADPGSATKKQVYHEMKIQVYNGTVAYRQMLYRFYMTLSADQMLYSRMFGAPRVRHTHGY
ncbi:MAG: hypothetical protein IJ552_02570 [Prevotella sp.]|nr:hypothetical protein [Prevotella sp.]